MRGSRWTSAPSTGSTTGSSRMSRSPTCSPGLATFATTGRPTPAPNSSDDGSPCQWVPQKVDTGWGPGYRVQVIPDHNPNDGAAPEQYDADWFLSQMRGRP